MTVDTKSVQRRTLRLDSLDALLREAKQLVEAERSGTLIARGNWTLGQMLGHLAAWTDYPYDGYPAEFRPPPWLLRVLLKSMKKKFLTQSLPVGMRLPKVKQGTFGTELLSTEEGLRRLTRSVERLRAGPPSMANPVFGPMTHEEWTAIMLRHGELHCSFFAPRG